MQLKSGVLLYLPCYLALLFATTVVLSYITSTIVLFLILVNPYSLFLDLSS